MSIELIIFDLDGTICDSLADLTDATNNMLRHFNRPELSAAEVRELVGQGARKLVERALPGASAEDLEAGLGIFIAYNEAHIADKTRLYPGVRETLARLKNRGTLLAVVSNKNVALCCKLLAVCGIEEDFVAILGADSLPFRKPSPEPLLKLMKDLAVTPSQTLMVGDSINDIVAGKGAAVTTVGCVYGYGDEYELVDADFLIESFAGILTLPI